MAQITIIGLGPGSPECITLEAWRLLLSIQELWLRTVRHPVTPHLPDTLQISSFDDLYENLDTFDDVYAAIVARILALAKRDQGVFYGVPGHPWVGEATVSRILSAACEQQIPVRVIAGVSFLEPALQALQFDALDGLQIVDALDIVSLYHPPLNPDFPALIAQVYNSAIASDLKLVLMNQYPDEHEVALVDASGTDAQTVVWLPLYEIDRHTLSPLTSLYVQSLPPVSSFEGFQQTVARLRAPDGCPWDREQTHASLRASLLEETYEVLDAIDLGDRVALREELGDLLLQIVLHAQIAVEEGEFYMADVLSAIDAKLKHRHPHVWGDVQVEGSTEVVENWEAIKRGERETNGLAARSMLDSVPVALPALAQAVAYGGRVTRIGLQLAPNGEIAAVEDGGSARDLDLRHFVDQTIEDIVLRGDDQHADSGAKTLGDLLFAIANWAAKLGLDPESALREANQRFVRRFRKFETEAGISR